MPDGVRGAGPWPCAGTNSGSNTSASAALSGRWSRALSTRQRHAPARAPRCCSPPSASTQASWAGQLVEQMGIVRVLVQARVEKSTSSSKDETVHEPSPSLGSPARRSRQSTPPAIGPPAFTPFQSYRSRDNHAPAHRGFGAEHVSLVGDWTPPGAARRMTPIARPTASGQCDFQLIATVQRRAVQVSGVTPGFRAG